MPFPQASPLLAGQGSVAAQPCHATGHPATVHIPRRDIRSLYYCLFANAHTTHTSAAVVLSLSPSLHTRPCKHKTRQDVSGRVGLTSRQTHTSHERDQSEQRELWMAGMAKHHCCNWIRNCKQHPRIHRAPNDTATSPDVSLILCVVGSKSLPARTMRKRRSLPHSPKRITTCHRPSHPKVWSLGKYTTCPVDHVSRAPSLRPKPSRPSHPSLMTSSCQTRACSPFPALSTANASPRWTNASLYAPRLKIPPVHVYWPV